LKKSYVEQMQDLANEYCALGLPWPATRRTLAAWAVTSGRWKPQQSDLLKKCAEDFAMALREEYIQDPQGRRVRAKHAARIRDGEETDVLWDDIRTASREHMEISLKQRRQQIVGDCHQLQVDVESYNDNANAKREPIQILFDFNDDLAEIRALESLRAGRANV
jgi:hypothetical protein